MPIGAGHAAATTGQHLQLEPGAGKGFLPEADAGGLVGLFSAMRQEVVRFCRRAITTFLDCGRQPFLRQHDLGHILAAQRLAVLLAVNQGHGRVQTDQRDAVPGQLAQRLTVETGSFLERLQKTLHLQRLAIGRKRCEVDLITET